MNVNEAAKKHSNWVRPMSTENDEMKNCSDDFKAGAAFTKAYESERVKGLVEYNSELIDKKNALIAIIKRQREALEFYAKAHLYQSGGMGGGNPIILDDYGTVSRATLAATKEELKKLGVVL